MIKVFKATDTNFNTNGEVILKPIEAYIYKDIEEEYIEVECPLKYADFLVQDNILVVDTLTGRKGYKIHNPIVGYTITVKAWLIWQESPPSPADRGAVISHGKNIKDLEFYEDWDDVVTKLIPVGYKEIKLPEGHLSIPSPYQKVYEKTIEFDLSEELEEEVELLEEEVQGKEAIVNGLENSITVLKGRIHACTSAISSLQSEKEDLLDRLSKLGDSEPEKKEKAIIEAQLPLIDEEIVKVESDKADTEANLAEVEQSLIAAQTEFETSKSGYEDLILNDLRKQAQEYLNVNKYPRINYDLEAHLKGVYEIGDTVRVKHPDMRVDLLTKVTAYELDAITLKFIKIEFGTLKTDLRKELDKIEEKIEDNKETIKKTATSITKYRTEYKRDNEEMVSKFMSELYGTQNGIYGMLQKNQSTFRQTASEISGTVTRVNSDLSEDIASLIIRADSIESSVSSNFTTLDGKISSNTSKITQAASEIRSEVSSTLRNYSTTTQMNSSISQTASQIRSEVSSAINGVNQNISVVEQTANKISWLVKSGTTSSNFTLTDRAISQVADKIDLTGYVTFNSLSTPGQTTIDGGNIKTGTLEADSIKSGGTITGNKFTNGNVTIDNSDITIDGRSGYLKGKSGSSIYNLIGFDGSASSMTVGNSSLYSTSTITLLGRYIDLGRTTSTAGYTTVRVNGLRVLTTADIKNPSVIQDDYYSNRSITLSRELFRPNSSGVISLGSSSYRFNDIYSNKINISSSVSLANGYRATLGFFGSSGSTKTSISTVSTSATLTTVRKKLNDLIVALRSYGIV